MLAAKASNRRPKGFKKVEVNADRLVNTRSQWLGHFAVRTKKLQGRNRRLQCQIRRFQKLLRRRRFMDKSKVRVWRRTAARRMKMVKSLLP